MSVICDINLEKPKEKIVCDAATIAKKVIGFLNEPTTKWVNRNPIYQDEYCLLTAIGHVCRKENLSSFPITEPLYAKINSGISTWNDTPGRTKQDVINLLQEIVDKSETTATKTPL